MTKSDKVLGVLLRFVGVSALFALVAVFMPMSWMALERGVSNVGPMAVSAPRTGLGVYRALWCYPPSRSPRRPTQVPLSTAAPSSNVSCRILPGHLRSFLSHAPVVLASMQEHSR